MRLVNFSDEAAGHRLKSLNFPEAVEVEECLREHQSHCWHHHYCYCVVAVVAAAVDAMPAKLATVAIAATERSRSDGEINIHNLFQAHLNTPRLQISKRPTC